MIVELYMSDVRMHVQIVHSYITCTSQMRPTFIVILHLTITSKYMYNHMIFTSSTASNYTIEVFGVRIVGYTAQFAECKIQQID